MTALLLPRDRLKILERVVDMAALVMRGPELPSRLPALASLAQSLDQVPAMSGMILPETPLLLECLAEIEREREARNADREMHWLMVAGVLMPLVRENYAQAFAAVMRAPTTTDHDFQRVKS